MTNDPLRDRCDKWWKCDVSLAPACPGTPNAPWPVSRAWNCSEPCGSLCTKSVVAARDQRRSCSPVTPPADDDKLHRVLTPWTPIRLQFPWLADCIAGHPCAPVASHCRWVSWSQRLSCRNTSRGIKMCFKQVNKVDIGVRLLI